MVIAEPRLYTIPPGLPFLSTLAEALLAGDLPAAGGRRPTPVSLAKITLLLPTRRATRALQDAFLAAGAGAALLLPKIRPIAEGVEELSLLTGAANLETLGPDSADFPAAMGELQRRLVLTELVMSWSRAMRSSGDAMAPVAGAGTPAQAAGLAAELARLMDLVETEGVSLDGLDKLVPEEFSEHWVKTLDFLKIVVEAWPAYLAASGLLSPAERRNRVLRAEAERLRTLPSADPVIVAGVTGSIPAAAEVMRAVAGLANGAIVLPGLDQSMDDATFASVPPDHPQAGFARLLADLGARRADVVPLYGDRVPTRRVARACFLSEALRPADSTDQWHGYVTSTPPDSIAEALADVHLLEAPGAQDEAEAVALILREAIETPRRTAALVTPDRLLARRVIVRLAAWGITVDDSAGRPFGKTVPGAFLDLVITAAEQDFAPAAVMALAKHPLTRLDWTAAEVRRAARFLELGAFRAPYLGRGLDGIVAALERGARESVGDSDVSVRRPLAARRLWEADWALARDLVARLASAYAPLLQLGAGPAALQALARAHVAVAEAIARRPPPADAGVTLPASPLFTGEAGEAVQRFFTALVDPDLRAPALSLVDYPDFYRGLVAGEAVRPRQPVHPRLAIWGPFEARLQQPDVVVLGSMNDGTWPENADPGPWLNRPMRATLGLPPPEDAIGRAAHDVTQLFGAERVYVTRALKIDGVPTVPSRWLMRIEALLAGLGRADAMAADRPWLGWARARDLYVAEPPHPAPAPCPPLALRPRRLSVTEIERWAANPYAIYARHVLGLEALPALGAAPGAALKGAIIHDALGRFATRHPSALPPDVFGALVADLDRVLDIYAAHPRVAAFWRPRLARFARWFADTEPQRRAGVSRVHAEVSGKHVLAGPAGPFTLSARADRFDVAADGLTIIDYKTGQAPSAVAVDRGRSPQLPLEGLIALQGGFADVPVLAIARLQYVRATGGEPPGRDIVLDIPDIAGAIARARAGLEQLIAAYDDPATPYRALRRASFGAAYDYDDFAHLARVKEWSAARDEG